MGDLAAAALDRGYDVLMTDVQDELLATAAARHPDGRPPRASRRARQRIAACTTWLSATSAKPLERLNRNSTSHPAPIPRLTEPSAPAADLKRSSTWARSRRSSVLASTR